MNYDQIERKQEKLKILLNAFRDLKDKVGSIKELSNMLGEGFSKSSIQRYFHEMYELKMINDSEYDEICEWLKNNIKSGTALGGIVTQERYGYSQDELGHFKGGRK